jgi:ribosomal protein S18 acetylase RimI-like enzyme
MAAVRVRKARQEDVAAVARLLFESAPDMYMRFSGGRERALATLERAFSEPGNVASGEVTWLAELDGRPAAAMAAFPVAEAAARSQAFLGLTLRGTPFWRWPSTLRLFWAGGRASPKPRESSFYVDALATDAAFRRRGAARALLEEAERQAGERGLSSVALDTTMSNEGARALYAAAGFDEVAYRAPSRSLPGFVALLKPVDRSRPGANPPRARPDRQ